MTNRVYDISTLVMLIALMLATLAIVMAVYSPSWTMFQSEITGAWLTAAMATGLAAHVIYVWCFGRKTAEPIISG